MLKTALFGTLGLETQSFILAPDHMVQTWRHSATIPSPALPP